uniref:WD repeat, SAM and U-box domain-containing protein 1 n=1 Tax=Biomphalaria glabrata TaxID=6526 RepID=A0A2C9LBD3_BIOGL
MFVSRYRVVHGKDLRYSNDMSDRRVRGSDSIVASNIHTITAHEGDVTAVAFSNTVLATCSSDKTVRLWSNTDFLELPSSPLLGHKYLIHCCEFSPLGFTLATCSQDGTLRIWDIKTGECVLCASHPSKCAIRVCRFSSDGAKLVTGGDDETVCLWNVAEKRIIRSFKGHDESVTSTAFSPDDSYIVSCSSGGDLGGDMLVWDASFGHGKNLTRVHDCHDLGVTCCSFSPKCGMPDSHSDSLKKYLIATCGNDNLVKLWNLVAEVGSINVTVKLETMLPGHKDSVLWLCFSPDGNHIASCSLDKTVRLWNVMTQQAIISIDEHLSYVSFCAFSKDSKYLATASNDRTVKVWKLSDTSVIMANLSGYEEGGITPGYPSNESSQIPNEAWSIEEVCQWLSSLGLGVYEETFRKNAIDGKELNGLTAHDLETVLGVAPLGHRSKILRNRNLIPERSSCINKIGEPSTTPEEFLCPITHEIMKEPVIASDGYTYDKLAMLSWLEKEQRSPMTNMNLTSAELVPNRTLKMMIQKFLQNN